MARAPFQVLVMPYRRTNAGGLEYAVFKRADDGKWQGLSGGGEDEEYPIEAARREVLEECGLPDDTDLTFMPLDAKATIPKTRFAGHTQWSADLYVVPEHAFGVNTTGLVFWLSEEHTEMRWLTYSEAYDLLTWDSNRTALWELHVRLVGIGEG